MGWDEGQEVGRVWLEEGAVSHETQGRYWQHATATRQGSVRSRICRKEKVGGSEVGGMKRKGTKGRRGRKYVSSMK